MIAHILKDPWTYLCTAMIVAVQWVMDHIGTMAGILMFIGSAVALFFRIRADIRKDKHEREIQEWELKIKEQELNNLRKQ